ncbi:MAG: nicotinate phosphoribosyltransferase, partial [Bacteroidota bacterium]
EHDAYEDVLVPVFDKGKRVMELPELAEVRARTIAQLARFSGDVLQLKDAAVFPVGLEANLYEIKVDLMRKARPE